MSASTPSRTVTDRHEASPRTTGRDDRSQNVTPDVGKSFVERPPSGRNPSGIRADARVESERHCDVSDVTRDAPVTPDVTSRGTDAGLSLVKVSNMGDLSTAPPKRRWFLSDLRTGAKVVAAGKAFSVLADGGVGKSFLALQLAVSAALEVPFLDTFSVETPGRTALVLGEDDLEDVHDRLYRICNALGLGKAERTQVGERVAIVPAVGLLSTNLITADRYGKAQPAAFLNDLIELLNAEATAGGFEWACVTIDPLARFAGPGVETDNNMATQFVAAVESISTSVRGRPTVLVTHHTAKVENRARSAGEGRGVSGIRNGIRAVFSMIPADAAEIRGVLIEHTKRNLTRRAAPLWLVRLEDQQIDGRFTAVGGVLIPASPEQVKALEAAAGLKATTTPEQKIEAKRVRTQEETARKRADVLDAVPFAPETASTAEVDARLRNAGVALGTKTLNSILLELARLGQVEDQSAGGRATSRQWTRRTQ